MLKRKIGLGLLLLLLISWYLPAGWSSQARAAVMMEALPSSVNVPLNVSGWSAVPLGNQILVTGGRRTNNNASAPHSPIYQPGTGTWATHAPALQRSYHRQSQLQDGRVMATGGSFFQNGVGSVYNATPLIYNPQSNSWSNAASLPKTIFGNSQSTLNDGRVMIAGGAPQIAGGADPMFDSVYLYNPATNSWSEGAKLPKPLYFAAQSTLLDGRVLVTGGQSGYVYSFESYIYDPATNTWSQAAALPYQGWDSYFRHAQVTLPNGKVLVMGNRNFHLYDPVTNVWTQDAPTAVGLINPSMVVTGSGDVYVMGGYFSDTWEENYTVYKLTFDFDPPTAPSINGLPTGWISGNASFTLTPGTDTGSGVDRTEYRLTGASTLDWTVYPPGSSIDISNAGQTTVSARTIDKAGNASTIATANVRIDRTANRTEYRLTGATTLNWTTYSSAVTVTAAGQTTVEARTIDHAGNISSLGSAVVRIDRTAPAAPTVTPGATGWSNANVQVTVAAGADTGGAGVNRTEYRLTGATTLNWTTYSSAVTVTAAGQTTIEARTIDHAGNISSLGSAVVRIDRTAPAAPTVTPGATGWSNANVQVTVAAGADTGGAGVNRTEYRLTGATTLNWTTYSSAVTVTAAGQTTVEARTIDHAGNISSVGSAVVRIDRTAPVAPTVTPGATGWSNANVQVTVAAGADTGGAGVNRTEYRLTGATTLNWTTYSSAVTVTAAGQTTIEARTIDHAGNISSVGSAVVRIDRTAPAAPTVTPGATGWSNANVQVTVAAGADTGGAGVNRTEYRLTGATTLNWTTYSSAVTVTAAGQTTIEARTIDNAGNISSVGSAVVRIDRTAPTSPVILHDAEEWLSISQVNVTIQSGSDEQSGVRHTQYRLSGAETADWTTYNETLAIQAEGATTVYARTIDEAGNVSEITDSIVRIDRTAPSAPSIHPDEEGWHTEPISISITTGTDNLSGIDRLEYRLSGAVEQEWTAYREALVLSVEGQTQVDARTIDKAGNSSEITSQSFLLELTSPPQPLLTADTEDWTSAETVKVTIAAGDPAGPSGVARIEYRLEGAVTLDWAPYTDALTLIEEGETLVSARAFSHAGLVSEEAELTVRIDRTAPSEPTIDATESSWTAADVEVTITSGTDALSGI
ncbi:OmpL47-type beta-barrel domain-containing protein, partial [Paenibacillus daejeonensis]|uniref:OmpL47-type beta-barrel domain-containing protein n=1 Tax=Paenibacillus daejeonensis TaxID=135193 RepID=UPI002480E3BA